MAGIDLTDLQHAGDNPAETLKAARVVATHAASPEDHRTLAEMIGVPVVQALPKPRRKRRCRTCGYLIAAPGHKRQCGGA